MADNINFNLNNSFDRFSNGFSLPSAVVMPQNISKPEEKGKDVYIPVKEPEKKDQKPDVKQTDNNATNPIVTEEPRHKKPLGKIVFYSMLVAAGFVLLLTKGLSGSTAGKVRALVDKWENQFIRKASGNKVAGAVDKTMVSSES